MTATTATMDITNPVLRGMYPDPSWMWDERGERVALVNSSFELVPGLRSTSRTISRTGSLRGTPSTRRWRNGC